MERGILISASGMESMLARQDIIAIKLANASHPDIKATSPAEIVPERVRQDIRRSFGAE
jgi:flagellar basal body rod protein FlgG